jgi:hypothetical protein
MREPLIRHIWREPKPLEGFGVGVCLHGHTKHSVEPLNFLPRYLHAVPLLAQVARYYERPPRAVDFARAWWTPPLAPAAAVRLEGKQIEALGLRPMVSLTDHDDVSAGLSLGATAQVGQIPISCEWTVPYAGSFFHIGVHNIPRRSAASWMEAMREYTAHPRECLLPAVLGEFARVPEVLLVLNHPFWLEEEVAGSIHDAALSALLDACAAWIGALELNGTREWNENAATIELARRRGFPLVSGGDRHVCEPSACINLTSARDFSEFADEVRKGRTTVLFLNRYREPMAQRIVSMLRDVLRTYPEDPGRERWSDRIFYRHEDGRVESLAQICAGREPRLLAALVSAIRMAGGERLRPAWRAMLRPAQELLP